MLFQLIYSYHEIMSFAPEKKVGSIPYFSLISLLTHNYVGYFYLSLSTLCQGSGRSRILISSLILVRYTFILLPFVSKDNGS